jgi:antitoxin ParD1/3/4
MRRTMNLSLPNDLKQWVDQQVESGGYGTASEFLRDLLRRARERQLRRHVDSMLVEAVDSGANTVMDDADWRSIRKAARSSAIKPSTTKSAKS